MMLREIPVQTLLDEKEQLQSFLRGSMVTRTYGQGAIALIDWLITGENPPHAQQPAISQVGR